MDDIKKDGYIFRKFNIFVIKYIKYILTNI